MPQVRRLLPKAPTWSAHYPADSSDYRKNPFVQYNGTTIDKNVFTGNEMALRNWAGW